MYNFTYHQPATLRQAVNLLAKTEAGTRPVRLLGAGVHNLGVLPDDKGDGDKLPFEAER